jgi:hypothetical protein
MPFRLGTNRIGRLVVGEAVVPWTPASFTNAQYWWTADAGVTESGGSVTAWTDQINGYQLVNGGTPTLTTEAGLNNQNAIDFNGSTDFLYATTTPASRTGDFTILGVYYIDDISVNDSIFGISLSPNGSILILRSVLGNTAVYSNEFGTPLGSTIPTLSSPGTLGAHAGKLRYDATGKVFGALDSLTEVAGGTTGNTNHDFDAGSTFSTGAWVNGTAGTIYAGRYYNGRVAELVMIYDTPTAGEMTEWQTYVNNKYGTIIT